MPLPVPTLDDRTFQDLVNEARRRIPLYCPEWTDHNLSDPGITLIELFAWMTELIIYRLNKVPDKNYVKFLELMGVSLKPANPASTDITLKLSAAIPEEVTIPAGTEVATVRTETQNAIVFTVDEDLTIIPPQIEYFLVSGDGVRYDDRLPMLREWEAMAAQGVTPAGPDQRTSFPLFQSVPQPGNSFYLGYSTNLRSTVLSITLNCDEAVGTGINPANPPLLWEYWDTLMMDWVPLERRPASVAWLEADGTRGLNTSGQVILHIPGTTGRRVVDSKEGFWIRCTVTPSSERQGAYDASPTLRGTVSESIGGTVAASNAVWVRGERLGTSDGKPGQVMQVSRLPMLPLASSETIETQREDDAGWESWEQVPDFSNSTFQSKHFVCDSATGEIQFGPVIRSAQGDEVRYGATPFGGSQVRLSAYRTGGGPRGNVGSNTLTVLKSSIPFVASVTNRQPATGGVDPEGIENLKLRAPHLLRTRNRAVTEEDFEFLAKEASPLVGRTKCVQAQEVGSDSGTPPGVIQLLVAPAISAPHKRTTPEELTVPRELLEQIREYLDDRRLLTTTMMVSEPEYVWVSVQARVKIRRGANIDETQQAVEEKLYQYIHPIHGGADGNGWPFGRDLFVSELYSQIQVVPDVEYVAELQVFPVDPSAGQLGDPVQTLAVPAAALLCSHLHAITCF